ncbi:unnamed protein product, partial [Ectocarpus sp. 12 AP-2014]
MAKTSGSSSLASAIAVAGASPDIANGLGLVLLVVLAGDSTTTRLLARSNLATSSCIEANTGDMSKESRGLGGPLNTDAANDDDELADRCCRRRCCCCCWPVLLGTWDVLDKNGWVTGGPSGNIPTRLCQSMS